LRKLNLEILSKSTKKFIEIPKNRVLFNATYELRVVVTDAIGQQATAVDSLRRDDNQALRVVVYGSKKRKVSAGRRLSLTGEILMLNYSYITT
jgi:hypothetical protein